MPVPPRPIVLATQNPGKVAELRRLFAEAGLDDRFPVRTLDDCPGPFPEPEEGHDSFLENATLKALASARLPRHRCLADDSGLEVDALDGAPGVISSHYYSGGEDRADPRDVRDLANNARLLSDLEGVPPDARTTRFVSTMVLASPGGDTLATSRGAFEGRIGRPTEDNVPRGEGGFGYDPLFLVPSLGQTSAELSPEHKNRISHRADAARKMWAKLQAGV